MMPMFLQRGNGTCLGTTLFYFLGLRKSALSYQPLAFR
jgi:hypothetical protein